MIKRLISKISVFMMVMMIITSCSSNNITPIEKQPVNTETASPETEVSNETVTPNPSQTPEVTVTPEPTPEMRKPVKAKAVYVTGSSAGGTKLDTLIELVNETELNSLVIDIKEGGIINYDSQVPLVKELGLGKNVYKVDDVLKKCHENNINVIGRIVVFRDQKLAEKKPEFAIKKPNGGIWTEGSHGAWTNPYIEGVQDYNIEIAKEAVLLGFDEIQFDYVRFPTAKANQVNYGDNVPEKSVAISQFLKKATEEIKKVKDVPVSADIFGIVVESDRDGKAIGQQFDMLGNDIDYISPMIYPSHYANAAPKGLMSNGVGQKINGVHFTAPDLDPYGVVYQSLLKTKEKISQNPEFKADVRPYIQDFTLKLPEGYGQTYKAEQVRAQIKAIYDAGYEEWILWNSGNNYTVGALEKE